MAEIQDQAEENKIKEYDFKRPNKLQRSTKNPTDYYMKVLLHDVIVFVWGA